MLKRFLQSTYFTSISKNDIDFLVDSNEIDYTMQPNKKLPISIENDGLSDAVVAFAYKPLYSREIIEEKTKDELNRRFKSEFLFVPAPQNEANKKANIKRFIANREFRIQFSEDMVMTNIVGRYAGWTRYGELLQAIMEILDGVTYKVAYVRYVSLFDNVSIFDQVEGGGLRITTLPDFQGTEFNFRCNINDSENHNAVATIRLTNNKVFPERTASVVDIMVEAKLPNESTQTAWEYLHFLHYHEKNLFFLMMKEDFINHHNPVYD